MTDSCASDGWKRVPSIWLRWVSLQLSLVNNELVELRSSSTGSARTGLRPKAASEGPRPRRATALLAFPVMMKPAIMALSSVSTRSLVEMFRLWTGTAVGVAVAVGVGVAVGTAAGRSVGWARGGGEAGGVGWAFAVRGGVVR